jgi:4-carboxymuconolactone decarboxylase
VSCSDVFGMETPRRGSRRRLASRAIGDAYTTAPGSADRHFGVRDAAVRVTATQGRTTMNDYLPHAYRDFRAAYPTVANTLDQLGQAADGVGPLDERTRRLVHLGIAIGALAEGAVRSNVRKALDAGASVDEVRHVSLLAITTSGFPTAIAGLGWTEEVLAAP